MEQPELCNIAGKEYKTVQTPGNRLPGNSNKIKYTPILDPGIWLLGREINTHIHKKDLYF